MGWLFNYENLDGFSFPRPTLQLLTQKNAKMIASNHKNDWGQSFTSGEDNVKISAMDNRSMVFYGK